jgi:tetratricopeptide (TPR) repeat protein
MKQVFAHKLIFFLSLFFAFHAAAESNTVNSSFDNGLESAEKNDFSTAKMYFLEHLAKHPKDAHLCYNLGLIAQKEKNYSTAIWYFEKSLKYKPSLKEASTQIQICNKALGNAIEYENTHPAFKNKLLTYSLSFWTKISISLSFVLAFFIFLLLVRPKQRKIFSFLSFFVAFFFTFSLYCCVEKSHYSSNLTHGILVESCEDTFVDLTGNALEKNSFKAGQRLEIETLDPKSNRISLLTNEGKIVFIEKEKVLLF